MPERLHKVMAASGIASRRKSEEMIQSGRVTVNGEMVTKLGVQVDPAVDRIEVDGRRIQPERKLVVAMNKPKGVLTTMSDERGRRTVADLLPDMEVTLKPVGRLDKDTEGLLLFTNDGELASRLAHPRYGIWKTYRATVDGKLTKDKIERLEKGVYIKTEEDGPRRKTAPARVGQVSYAASRDRSSLEISIHEGRKRQVRLMLEALGNPVLELKRVRFGPISLKGMAPEQCVVLSKVQVDALRKDVGL